MQGRHGAGPDASSAARKPTTLHEVETRAQLFEKPGDLAEIVAVVRVPHDDVTPARRFDAACQRAAITGLLDANDPCSESLGNLTRSIGAAVVSDDDFSGDVIFAEGFLGLEDATLESVGFIQTRHDHRQFQSCLNAIRGRHVIDRDRNREECSGHFDGVHDGRRLPGVPALDSSRRSAS